MMNQFAELCCGNVLDIINAADNDLEGISDQLIQDIFDGKISKDQVPLKLYEETSKIFNNSIAAEMGSFGYADSRNSLTSTLRANIYAFAGAKSFSMQQEVRDQLLDTEGKVKSFSTFRRDAKKIIGQYNENWLSAEFDTAIGSAQMAKKWQQYEDDKDIYPNLTYRTVGDDRVSEEHAALEGLTRPVDDTIWDTIYPPNRFRCRCDVDQSDDIELTDAKDATAMAKNAKITKLFKRNTGREGIIFTDDIPYMKTLNKSKVKQLSATANYGMRTVEKILSKGKKPVAKPFKTEEEYNQWFDTKVKSFPDDEKTGFIIDDEKTGRLIQVDSEMKKKLKDKDRLYASEMINTILESDEVWTGFKSSVKFKESLLTTYIKYYNGEVLLAVVETSLEKKILRLKSFYKANSNAVVEDFRKGLLENKK